MFDLRKIFSQKVEKQGLFGDFRAIFRVFQFYQQSFLNQDSFLNRAFLNRDSTVPIFSSQ